MKKISLGVLAVMFAVASFAANGTVPAKDKRSKQESCTSCQKDECARSCSQDMECCK